MLGCFFWVFGFCFFWSGTLSLLPAVPALIVRLFLLGFWVLFLLIWYSLPASCCCCVGSYCWVVSFGFCFFWSGTLSLLPAVVASALIVGLFLLGSVSSDLVLSPCFLLLLRRLLLLGCFFWVLFLLIWYSLPASCCCCVGSYCWVVSFGFCFFWSGTLSLLPAVVASALIVGLFLLGSVSSYLVLSPCFLLLLRRLLLLGCFFWVLFLLIWYSLPASCCCCVGSYCWVVSFGFCFFWSGTLSLLPAVVASALIVGLFLLGSVSSDLVLSPCFLLLLRRFFFLLCASPRSALLLFLFVVLWYLFFSVLFTLLLSVFFFTPYRFRLLFLCFASCLVGLVVSSLRWYFFLFLLFLLLLLLFLFLLVLLLLLLLFLYLLLLLWVLFRCFSWTQRRNNNSRTRTTKQEVKHKNKQKEPAIRS